MTNASGGRERGLTGVAVGDPWYLPTPVSDSM